jgi:release factor glutamine methyltransferase
MIDLSRSEEMDFLGLPVRFDDRVLRPRPWTAAQSRWAADLLRTLPPGPVLELCAGAGQIGLLAVRDQVRRLVQVDIDPVACAFARHNAAAARLEHRVEVREGAMTDVLGPEERFALVIADPPWVPTSEVNRFPEDPLLAIDGGERGTDLVVDCLDTIAMHLLPQGVALLQLGSHQQAEVVADHLQARPGSHLEMLDEHSYADRGVLVMLSRA